VAELLKFSDLHSFIKRYALLRQPITRIGKGQQMASEGFHEPLDKLSAETMDMHRAISSLMEEFEAVDWYNQRIDAATDPELKKILIHNRDEEKEHAAMVLEWIRRRDPKMNEELRKSLFKDGPITDHHEE
jgi:ferritin-like protein